VLTFCVPVLPATCVVDVVLLIGGSRKKDSTLMQDPGNQSKEMGQYTTVLSACGT
jgi:hypothetical protein